jgi:ATP-dependent Clp protease ATP-binding subunit ClpX
METAHDRAEILSQVQPEDLVEFGMIPEFVGRLPLCATLEPLDTKTLISILTTPKNALVKQYQKFFRMEGCEVDFTPGALELIAQRALKRDTGARALRAVCEEIMLDLMYSLPDQGQGGKYLINEAVVEGKQALFQLKPQRRKESA